MDKLIDYLRNNIGENSNDYNYYDLVIEQFNSYLQVLSKFVADDNFSSFLKKTEQFIGPPTKRRFINLIREVQNQCLLILNLCYKGDFINATESLIRLLTKKKYTQYKLNDCYANYFTIDSKRLKIKFYYRRVDFSKEDIDIVPLNCWHVPFGLRYLAAKGRFNMLGYICFYLADSPQVAYAEVGKLDENKIPYIGKFELKEKCFFLNLTLPKVEEMSIYDKFCFLVTYPFYQLCLIKAKHKDAPFCEEYVFPQLFFHLLFCFNNSRKDLGLPNFLGISYNSLECGNNEGICVVIPANYQGNTPPKKGYSTFITSIFNQLEVVEYNNKI